MKKLICILFVILSVVCSATAIAQEATIYDENGNVQGYIKQDGFATDQWSLYDKDWNRTGHVRQNWLQPDRYDLFDQNWNRKGLLKKTDGERR